MVEVGEIAEVIAGQSPEGKYYNSNSDGLPFYQGKTEFEDIHLGQPTTWTSKTTKIAEKGDILMSVRAPVGPVNIATQKICIGRGLAAIRAKKDVDQMFLFYNLRSMQDRIKGNGGAVFDSINKSQIEKIKIPLPSLEIQKQMVEDMGKEEEVLTANRRLIELMERKISQVLTEI
ncbi:MAG: restriction endonuclease subunit S [Patescibacteria group bacterium]